MKTIILSIGLLLAYSYNSFAQDFPTKSAILKIIGDLNRKLIVNGDEELGIDTDQPFRFIDSKFTTLPIAECLVIVPVKYGLNTRDLVIHFKKINSTLLWTEVMQNKDSKLFHYVMAKKKYFIRTQAFCFLGMMNMLRV